MEIEYRLLASPRYRYAAYVDTEKKSETQGECLALLTDEYTSNDHCADLSQYDFLPPSHFREAALIHSLIDDYSIPLCGLNAPFPDDKDFGMPGEGEGWSAFRLKIPFAKQAPFILFCDFLSIDFDKFIREFVDLLLKMSKLYGNDRTSHPNRLKDKFDPFASLLLVDEEIEAFLVEQEAVDYQVLPYDEERSNLIRRYTDKWLDYILIQNYCLAYMKQPAVYGAPSHFAAFRRRYQIMDPRSYIPKMTGDANTERQLLYQAYESGDIEQFEVAFQQFTNNFSSLHCKTIVTSHLSTFLADMLEMIIDNQYAIKECKLCGRYFVPIENNNIGYCSRIYKGKKTCRDIGPSVCAQNKIKKNKIKNEMKRIYNRLRNQKERHPKQTEYVQKFNQFVQEKKRLEQAYRAGKISESEVLSELDTWKTR